MFEDETIEMTDFCMRFGNMPKNKYFEGNDRLLKAQLWNKMTEIMADQALTEGKISSIDSQTYE